MRVNYPCLWQLWVRDNAYLSTFSPVLKLCTAALSPWCRYQRRCFSLARRLTTWRMGDNEINLKKNILKSQISRRQNWKWITSFERNSRLMLVWWTCSHCHLVRCCSLISGLKPHDVTLLLASVRDSVVKWVIINMQRPVRISDYNLSHIVKYCELWWPLNCNWIQIVDVVLGWGLDYLVRLRHKLLC